MPSREEAGRQGPFSEQFKVVERTNLSRDSVQDITENSENFPDTFNEEGIADQPNESGKNLLIEEQPPRVEDHPETNITNIEVQVPFLGETAKQPMKPKAQKRKKVARRQR